MKESDSFYIYERNEWEKLNERIPISLSNKELEALRSLNDKISLEDVRDIYLPVIHLLNLYIDNDLNEQVNLSELLEVPFKKRPFIIGIAGSVAVGKSTVARLLQTLLAQFYPSKKVDLITTDGFLYPNKVLEEYNIMDRKGFPESYNMHELIKFLGDVKNGDPNIQVPKYSHDIYDIVPNEYYTIDQPDILIVEGINVLQLPSSENIYVSDFFDFSFYVDAEPARIEKWYLQRFGLLLETSFKQPENYYYKFTDWDRKEAFQYARNVWNKVNLVNLKDYILPTRFRADFILHKTTNHFIDYVLLRKH